MDFFAKLLRPLRGLAMTIRGHFRSVIMPSNLQLPKALTERRCDLIWNFPQQKVGKKAGPGYAGSGVSRYNNRENQVTTLPPY